MLLRYRARSGLIPLRFGTPRAEASAISFHAPNNRSAMMIASTTALIMKLDMVSLNCNRFYSTL